MSRTNHHRRYDRWNITEEWTRVRWNGGLEVSTERAGMEIHDLRFYAGCRRVPQAIHRRLHFHGLHPWRILYGRDGVAKSYADIREGQFRAEVCRYTEQARAVWNAGGDVDELNEPGNRPRSICWDLW